MSKVYNVKTPVEHNGERFEKGDEIELADKDADPLLAVEAIEDPADAKPPKPARAPKKVAKAAK